MSIEWIEGFEANQLQSLLSNYYDTASFSGVTFGAGRLHGSALHVAASGSAVLGTKGFTAGATWAIRFAIYLKTEKTQIVSLQKTNHTYPGSAQAILKFEHVADGLFMPTLQGQSGPVIEGAGIISSEVWHTVELLVTVGSASASTGFAQLRVDGFEVIPKSYIDSNVAGADADRVLFQLDPDTTTGNEVRLDDIIIQNEYEHLHEASVELALPYEDSTPLTWAPHSNPKHFANIDNSPTDASPSADYNSSPGVNKQDVVFVGPFRHTDPIAHQVLALPYNEDASDQDILINHNSITVPATSYYHTPPIILDPGMIEDGKMTYEVQ